MAFQNTALEYGSVAKFLHWLIAVLVLVLLALGFIMGSFKNDAINDVLYMIHKSLGLSVLGLIIIRLLWRISNVRPSLSSLPLWEQKSALINHLVLYLLLIVMPISGWIMSVAAGYPPVFFNLFEVPLPIEKNKLIADTAGEIHEFLAWCIIAFVTIHILAAFKHYLWDKDQVMQRMLPGRKRSDTVKIE